MSEKKGSSKKESSQVRLGSRLRDIRLRLGISIEEASSELSWPQEKLVRIETGVRPPIRRDLRDLCRFYEVSDETTDMLCNLAFPPARRDDAADESIIRSHLAQSDLSRLGPNTGNHPKGPHELGRLIREQAFHRPLSPSEVRAIAESVYDFILWYELKNRPPAHDGIFVQLLAQWHLQKMINERAEAKELQEPPVSADDRMPLTAELISKEIESTLKKHDQKRWISYIEGIVIGLISNGIFEAIMWAWHALEGKAGDDLWGMYEIEASLWRRGDLWLESALRDENSSPNETTLMLIYTIHALSALTME